MAPPSAPLAPTPFKPKPLNGNGEEQSEESALGEGDLDEDDLENSMSLTAIEAELKPKVLETFDKIADTFKRLRRLQDQDIHNKLHNESLSPAQERKYKKLKKEIIVDVNPKASAYLLAAYAEWFAAGTVFLCVVDPGVGGSRPPF